MTRAGTASEITLLALLLCSCSSVPDHESEAIASLPTNPKNSQHQIKLDDQEPEPDDPRYAPVVNQQLNYADVPTGSLFNARYARDVFSVTRYYKVGDLLLVRLEEKTSAKQSAGYKSSKKDGYTLDPVSLSIGKFQIDDNDLAANYEQEMEFDAGSDADQTNSLDGDITVSVQEIMPNGNLFVSGEKWITLSRGKEYVRFSGLIRPDDIDEENSISSYKVGNTRIEYSETGEIKDQKEAGWLYKLFGIVN